MPGYDRTGPMGQGPMTGGGFGRCTNYAGAPMGRGRGVSYGWGRRGGRGRGPGRWPVAAGPDYGGYPPQTLEERAADLRRELAEIESRMNAARESDV